MSPLEGGGWGGDSELGRGAWLRKEEPKSWGLMSSSSSPISIPQGGSLVWWSWPLPRELQAEEDLAWQTLCPGEKGAG